MRLLLCSVIASVILSTAARAEVPPMSPEKLEAMASHIFNGKLARIYSTVELSEEWETTYSVAELQLAKVEKGNYLARLAYVRFWRRKWKGKGQGPDGSYGHRDIPKVGSVGRAYVREAEDGGFDVVLPNGIELLSDVGEASKK